MIDDSVRARADLHRRQLQATIEWLEHNEEAMVDAEHEGATIAAWARSSLDAFRDMRTRGLYPLTEKQEQWMTKVVDRFGITIPHPPVPRGREVALLVEGVRPNPQPPGRRHK